jgi:penicillin amidase
MMVRATFILAALIVLLVAAGRGGFFWLRTSLPQMNGSITLAGLDKPVEVVRDAHSVPHIFAETEEDAYFALGFVHAQDRLWQMEFLRRLGAGRLAEVLGESLVGADRFFRTLGLYRVAEASVETLPPKVRAAFETYAAGVNAFLETRRGALPPEFVLLRYKPEPWRVADSLVWGRVMAIRLGRNWRSELLRVRLDEALTSKGLAPDLLAELWPDDPAGSPVTLDNAARSARLLLDRMWDAVPPQLISDGASNGWIVHGRLTDTGKPILANDPHLDFEVPGLWYLVQLEAPGLSLTGATVPGMLLTILGHNGSIAWGATNAGGDVEDLFVETLDPEDPEKYLTPAGPVPFETRDEVIRIKGGKTLRITVRETRHGPVISDVSEDAGRAASAGHVVALATPVLRPDDRTVEALFAINRARNWEDFLAAAADFHTPHQNLFFAARDGDIGFISQGRIPVRKAGDGRVPVIGADGSHDWKGFIPAEMLPRLLPRLHNPPSGRIVNANNRVVNDTYPYMITRDWAEPFRAERIHEVLDGKTTHSLADIESLQRDVVSTAARRLVPLMVETSPEDERGRHAVSLLSAWNYEMRRERPEPLIYTAWLRHLVRALAEDELGDAFVGNWRRELFVEAALTRNRHWCDDVTTTREETCEERLALALTRALDEIAAELGPEMDAWRWGELHRATFAHRVLTRVWGLAKLADLRIESDGGDHTVSRGKTQGGESEQPFAHTDGGAFRAVYDLADLGNSRFMIATGQSGNFLSRHYSDLLEPWRDGRYIKISGQRDEIAGTAIGILSLQPASP